MLRLVAFLVRQLAPEGRAVERDAGEVHVARDGEGRVVERQVEGRGRGEAQRAGQADARRRRPELLCV